MSLNERIAKLNQVTRGCPRMDKLL